MEGFESRVEAERIGSSFYIAIKLKREQELLTACIDVTAVLPTGFGKSLIFCSDVCHECMCGFRCKSKRRTGFSSVIVISPFQSIIRDQVSG